MITNSIALSIFTAWSPLPNESQQCRTSELLSYYQNHSSISTPDVTGDGVSDNWKLVKESPSSSTLFRLQHHEHPHICVQHLDHYVGITSFDVNGDQNEDLILSKPWSESVGVFFGPLRACVDFRSPDIKFFSENQSGLASWFGIGLAVLDANRDGAADLVIGAPGEGEEGCFGQISPRVFYGPFLKTSYEGKEGRILLGPSFQCLGHSIQCDDRNLRLFTQPNTLACFQFPLPLNHDRAPDGC